MSLNVVYAIAWFSPYNQPQSSSYNSLYHGFVFNARSHGYSIVFFEYIVITFNRGQGHPDVNNSLT